MKEIFAATNKVSITPVSRRSWFESCWSLRMFFVVFQQLYSRSNFDSFHIFNLNALSHINWGCACVYTIPDYYYYYYFPTFTPGKPFFLNQCFQVILLGTLVLSHFPEKKNPIMYKFHKNSLQEYLDWTRMKSEVTFTYT